MRIFLDTNVLASALATRGLCADLFVICLDSQLLLTGLPVLSELERILPDKFKLPASVVRGYLDLLQDRAEIVHGSPPFPYSPDPDDAPILACALAGKADVFVTGDRALLEMAMVDGMPVISPRDCWERLG